MIKRLTTLFAATLIFAGCGDDAPAGPPKMYNVIIDIKGNVHANNMDHIPLRSVYLYVDGDEIEIPMKEVVGGINKREEKMLEKGNRSFNVVARYRGEGTSENNAVPVSCLTPAVREKIERDDQEVKLHWDDCPVLRN